MTALYTVSQVNSYIRRMMDEDVFLAGLFVEAEISNFKEHSSGHLYFTLKDGSAAINAVMFRSNAQELEFAPENGMKIIAYGRVSAYEKTGAYQFYAETMQPMGLGPLFLAFSRLKTKLEAEGLFDPARKRPLPKLPACVGIVTSSDGAALRDIINVAARRNPRVKLCLAPAAVQGQGAAESIAAALEMLNAHGAADVIILGRGGGSMEDLWAFNEETVARAVAASRIPTVSAVGHETDFTICDFAADLRAPTPSAAAEICVPEGADLYEEASWLTKRMNDAMESLLDEYKNSLKRCLSKLPGPEALTETQTTRIINLSRRISRETGHKHQRAESRVKSALQALDLAAPLNVLKRGYGILQIDGEIIRRARDAKIKPGAEMSVNLADGAVYGHVTKVEETQNAR